MVGLGSHGSHGSLGLARDFRDEFGLRTPRMLWDDQGVSRPGLGTPREPAAVLVDRSGAIRRRWFGPFDGEDALRAAARL